MPINIDNLYWYWLSNFNRYQYYTDTYQMLTNTDAYTDYTNTDMVNINND